MLIRLREHDSHVFASDIIKPTLDEIKLLLTASTKVDILGLCRLFLDEMTDVDILHIQGFSFESKDRSLLNHTGILCCHLQLVLDVMLSDSLMNNEKTSGPRYMYIALKDTT